MIDVAVVGLGWWGRTIVKELADSREIRVVLGVDPDEGNRQAVTSGGIATASDLQAALIAPGIEAIVLCTPHRLHAEQVIRAARAGKHVFCEKPFSMQAGAAAAALDAVTAAGVRLGIGHERRFERPGGRCRVGCLSLTRCVRLGGRGRGRGCA